MPGYICITRSRPVPLGTSSPSKTGVNLGSVESYTAFFRRFTSTSGGTPSMAKARPVAFSFTPKTTVPPPPFAIQIAISTTNATASAMLRVFHSLKSRSWSSRVLAGCCSSSSRRDRISETLRTITPVQDGPYSVLCLLLAHQYNRRIVFSFRQVLLEPRRRVKPDEDLQS